MNASGKNTGSPLRAIAALGVVGAACLSRPVETWNPSLKTSFTNEIHSSAVDKLDLLFMIDNSASMGDKQALLAQAVPDMLNRLVTPNCLAADGVTVVGQSTMNGTCAMGKPEFPPVHDMHIGIVTSSLGGRGGDECLPTMANPANANLPSHTDDRAELINRGGDDEHLVANAGSPLNFLAWFPTVPANTGAAGPPMPVVAETAVGAAGMTGTLIGDFADMITGVHEHGCGFEAQNEAWYRFLVQPDPFDNISVSTTAGATDNQAALNGVDAVILQQRAAFLRPDSLLAVIVVTDENEEVANPMAVGKEGWLYEQVPWPDSPTGGGGPEGTIECMTNPEDPNCTSCALANLTNFATRCPPDPPSTAAGYLDPSDDAVNVRFFHQKQRFGIFSGYPISRYVMGLTSLHVPDRNHEVDGNGNYVGDQAQYANCVNPIFATNLPTQTTQELCALTPGPRTPDLVYYAAIAGVPHQLLQAMPGDPECNNGQAAADCPQKDQLAPADWLAITGTDPENYNFTGADPHMLESETPRTQCLPTGSNTCDPINGREWETQKTDLQYACIFSLAGQYPMGKDCTQAQYTGACDCSVGAVAQSGPLCEVGANGMPTTTQIYGKAYPSVREMEIAHAMADQATGIQGIVSSLCPIHTVEMGTGDPVFGYRPAVNAIIDRLKNALSVQCLPQQLQVDSTGTVPCLILVTLPKAGATCNTPGLSDPAPGSLTDFLATQEASWQASGGASSNLPNPSTLTTCVVTELTSQANPNDFDNTGSCAASMDPGWCYVQGQAAGTCPQQIIFTPTMPPQGATVNLQCLEEANGVVDGG
jgi:hypothetical protein